MHRLKRSKLFFWSANVAIAIVLFLSISIFVLYRLDDYTRHGHYILVPDLRGITPAEALPVAEEKQLHVIVVDSVYTRDLAGGAIVEQFPRPGAKVKNNRVIQLTVNARLPETVLFPDLRQSSYRQALQKLKSTRLRPGRIEYVPSPYANLVLGFHRDGIPVEAGTRVCVGEKINILLGEGVPPGETTVPGLAGKTLEEAREILLHAYLNAGEVIEDYTITGEAGRAAARVYDQRPRPGASTRGGSVVTLYLSRNRAKEPEPDDLAPGILDEPATAESE
ncbi:MAG: PASTA domain-containing protein [Odoribacteraceae bacterium]|jgi:beta-lactam-binding protein with PASTA domain|nr:PASTA domain-containing protein [Odoribacteraceae bacterium]